MDTEDTEDQVGRLLRFEARHPEWQVISPVDSVLRGETEWRAIGPDGQRIRAVELRDLLDKIEGTKEAPA